MLAALKKHRALRASTFALLLLSLLAPMASLSLASAPGTCTMKCCKTAKASSCHRTSSSSNHGIHSSPACKSQCCAHLVAPVLPLLLVENSSTAAFLSSLPALRVTEPNQQPRKESLPRHLYQRPPPTLS